MSLLVSEHPDSAHWIEVKIRELAKLERSGFVHHCWGCTYIILPYRGNVYHLNANIIWENTVAYLREIRGEL